jgi:hypothetical protein
MRAILMAGCAGFVLGVAATVFGPYEPVETHHANGVTCATHQPEAWLVCREDARPDAPYPPRWFPRWAEP